MRREKIRREGKRRNAAKVNIFSSPRWPDREVKGKSKVCLDGQSDARRIVPNCFLGPGTLPRETPNESHIARLILTLGD